jgi:hypothetical protein
MWQHLDESPHLGISSSQELNKAKLMGHGGTTQGLFGCNPLEQGPGFLSSNRISQNTKSSNMSPLPSFASMGQISFGSHNPGT